MLGLYFGSVVSTISTCAILVFAGYSIRIIQAGNSYTHWGKALVFFLVLGTFMSAMSGTRDGIGGTDGFPTKGTLFITLCALGGTGFIVGLVALITKLTHAHKFFRIGTYILMGIILVKTVLVEAHRISEYFSK